MKNEVKKFCHHLLCLKWLQIFMNLFILLNTNEDILKKVENLQPLTSKEGKTNTGSQQLQISNI